MSEDVAAIKAAIEDVKEKLSKIEAKKGSIRDSVYQKVKKDYEVRLQELNGQLAGKKELLKESLKDISEKKQPLKSKLDVLQEQLEEIELRHSIGEYSDAQYDSMSGEIKEKMLEIESDLESIKKEEKNTKDLLGKEGLDVEEGFEDFIEGKKEEEEVSEKEESEEEPLPEVAEENMIAEELFTGNEKTVEESESVMSAASAAEEENKALLEVEKGESQGEEQLFDLSGEKEEEEIEKEASGDSQEEEDWLSSLEQELNEEAEEGKKTDKVVKAEETAIAGKVEKEEGEGLFSICPKCNYKNSPDAWYCENCGSELTSTE
jgi:hypothetical protein